MLIKRILQKGTGFDRVEIKDEIKIDIKIFQNEVVLYEDYAFKTIGSSDSGVFEILKSMKKDEISQVIVKYEYFIENFKKFDPRHLINQDIKVDISILELNKIKDLYNDGLFYKKELETGIQQHNNSQLNASLEIKYQVVLENTHILITNMEEDNLKIRLDEDEVPSVWTQCLKYMKIGEYCKIDHKNTGEKLELLNDGLNPKLNPEISKDFSEISIYLRLISSDFGKTNHNMTPEERFEESLRLKDVALKYFKCENLVKALEKYDNARTVLEPLKDGPETHKPTYTILLNNMGLCYIKLDKRREAESILTKALDVSPTDLKSLYRRSIARTGLSNYDGALEDLYKAQEISLASNDHEMLKTLDNEVKKIQIMIKKYKLKEKEIYKNLFK